MYSSHSYPYQLGNQQQQPQQQQQQQPLQYSAYTPCPPTQPPYPHPQPAYQPPSYPHPQPQSQPRPPPSPVPSPTYPHPPERQPQRPPQPPPRPQQLQPPSQPACPPYPSPSQPAGPPYPSPSQPAGPPYPSPYSPPESQPVSMPVLQRPDPSPSGTAAQEIGDPRFVLLLSMSTEELTGLLEDEQKFSEVFTNMEELKQKKLEKEMTMAENRSLADFNLSREPRLTEGRAQLISRLHEAQQLMDSYTVGKSKLESLRQQNSLDTALALMQAATANAEDDSEEVADTFLKGDLPLEDFLETFIPKRQTAHLRHIKSEKMQEMLNRQRQSRVAAPSNAATPPYPAPRQQPNYQQPGTGPYTYQPQRPAPMAPIAGPRYGPGALPPRMPTLGSYPQ